MKKITLLTLFCIVTFLCCTEKGATYEEISSRITEKKNPELFLSGVDNTNLFYELSATDSFAIFLDYYNDTILQAYRLEENPTLEKFLTKGQGPGEVIFPFLNKAVLKEETPNSIYLYDLNNLSIGTLHLNSPDKRAIYSFERIPLSLPLTADINILPDKIIGRDIDQQQKGLCYIYDRKKEEIKTIPYFPQAPQNRYSEESLPFLYAGNVCVNEEKERIVISMEHLNLIQIYDFQSNRKRALQIDGTPEWPVEDSEIVNFPDSPTYSKSICGTKEYVYILYRGDSETSKIVILNWEGDLYKIIETDYRLERIAVDKNNRSVLGLHVNAEDGCDVLKINL